MSLGRCTPCRFWAWTLDLETETPGQPLIQTETPGWFRVQLSEYYNFGQIDPLDAALFLAIFYRKWPSEASNPHFFPLRGLKEGCALSGGRNPSLTWEAARQKRRFFTKTGSKVPFSQGLAGLHPLYGRAGPLTFKNLRGVTPGPGVREHGYRPVQPCPRQGAPPPARLACAGSRTHTRPARPRAPWAILCPGALFHNFCAQIRAGLDDQSF